MPAPRDASSELDVVGIPREMKPAVAVLRGRLAEALGHDRDALDDYKFAVGSPDRQAAAEAKLLELIAAAEARARSARPRRLRELETLSVTWRGDGDRGARRCRCWRRSMPKPGATRRPLRRRAPRRGCSPIREASRQAQDVAAALFTQLFLSPKGDDLPPIDALGDVLRISRTDADRPARRRNDPAPRRPARRGRPARPGRRAPAIPGRQAAGRRGARAGRRAAGDGLSRPTASRTAPSPRCARPASPISPANCGSSGCCWRRARRATSAATTSRSTSSPTSPAARRSGCAPTSTGRRGAGARPPSRSSSITASAGATSSR